MSIAELESQSYQDQDGPGPDRLPPQDAHAEQSVIGGMLMSKDAIADCVEVLRSTDFYRPAHEFVYDAILDLYGRGEPADAITVADELTKRGDLARVGGQAYLHQLISSVPTAANAGYYAQIVAERAVLRRLVDAGTRIVQMGFGTGGGDVEDIVNAAQAEVYAVSEKRGGEDYAPIGDIIEATVDEIEHAQGSGGEMIGVPTGFTDLDALTNGLHPGQMIVVAARPAVGKALALDTPLPTPDGWTTMGQVAVGERLLGADGQPTTVVAATDVMSERPCYEVEFSDGTVIVADGQHQWLTDTRGSRRSFQSARDHRNRQRNRQTFAEVRTTEQIRETLRCRTADARLNHSVKLARALQLPEQDQLLPPYVLGAWLGDGTSASASFTTADQGIVMQLEAEGLQVSPTSATMRYRLTFPVEELTERNHHGTVQACLRTLGVLGNKHIPAEYLRGSEAQRRALLAGLLDTDGTVASSGCVQFTTTSTRLAADVHELIVSLGYRVGESRKTVAGHDESSSTAFTLTFSSDEDVFLLERKRLLHKELHKELRRGGVQRRDSRFIVDVRPVPSVPVRCVEVDNDSHLYLAGRSMVPTHNSTLGLDVARAAAIKNHMATAVFSLEMSRTEITMRLLSAEAQIQLQHMRKGTMRDEDWTRLARTMGEVSDAPLFIDDSPNMSLMEIRSKCRRLKQKNNLKLVIIDYLQLMTSGKKIESRQQEVAEFSRALKLLAKELEVPVIAISQLNRGSEQRTDKRPQMSDLRESGCLTADTRILRADTGSETTLGELHASGERDVPVWALDDSLRYVRRHMTHVFPTGTKPVFRLTLRSGKTIRATENHPFLAYNGWTQLGDLRSGDRVAVPRHVPAPEEFRPWQDAEVALLAHQLSGVTSAPPAGSVVGEWLGRLGLLGSAPADRFVPGSFAHASKPQLAMLIRSLWSTDGGVLVDRDALGGRIWISSLSRQLLDDVARLLLRFGISAAIRERGRRDGVGFVLDVEGVDDQRRFLQEIAGRLSRDGSAGRLLGIVRRQTSARAGAAAAEDSALWGRARAVIATPGPGCAGPASEDLEDSGVQPLGRLAALLEEADLELDAINDVLWDEVASVELDGAEEVYDATVLGTHNFIANGIAVHNSIEQDADMVILIHREAMYEKESAREGEADLIVAKHRNGPTDTIVVAFQGHYSRFTNMATNF
ncbi:MAG TPA: replicative DNA helicase [Segeticoccus sp.]|nr:replicative DNA helicase [Segeticoccus sp.]